MAGQFQGKVALITGGSSGIGRTTAIAFAREGARVVITADKDVAGGKETEELIRHAGGEATFIKADVSKATDVEAMVNKTVELYERLDYAYNNAGISGSHLKTADCTEIDWDKTIGINLKGVWLCMKREIMWMLEHGGGAIVNNASVGGLQPLPANADYVASKFGLVGLTKAAALEYARDSIRINVICPGIIDTRMTRTTLMKQPNFDALVEKDIPQGRIGTSEEVAALVLWLCSDEASFVTGAAIPVDGGNTLV